MNLTIDGQKIQVEEGTSVLEAARKANIHIPTLCYLPEVQAIGACRVCLVEVQGTRICRHPAPCRPPRVWW